MNIMHNKTVKFIMRLHHATQWRTTQYSEVSKYQLTSQPKLDKLLPVAMLQQIFEVMATSFRAERTKTFAPLINIIAKIQSLSLMVNYRFRSATW